MALPTDLPGGSPSVALSSSSALTSLRRAFRDWIVRPTLFLLDRIYRILVGLFSVVVIGGYLGDKLLTYLRTGTTDLLDWQTYAITRLAIENPTISLTVAGVIIALFPLSIVAHRAIITPPPPGLLLISTCCSLSLNLILEPSLDRASMRSISLDDSLMALAALTTWPAQLWQRRQE